MLKLQDLLSQIRLLKNLFDLANTLSDDISPPWNNEYVQGETFLSNTPVPLIVRKILVANFRLASDTHDRIKQHVTDHTECSVDCSKIQEYMKELQDHRVISSFVQYLIMRHVDNFDTPWIILNDWHVVVPTETSRIEDMFTLQFMSPPTAEEKQHGS